VTIAAGDGGQRVRWEDELPIDPPPSDPAWRENLCFDGYDARTDLGFWVHMGRWPGAPELWREQVLVYAPGGDFWLHRGWGHRRSDKGASGALLELTCEEPGAVWRLNYRGPARRTSSDELRGAVSEAAQELLELDLSFTTSDELWFMGPEIADQSWAHQHSEHTGRMVGTVNCGGRVVEVDMFAWRDHSRGPRHLGSHRRHCWIHGQLPNERTFALTAIESGPKGTADPSQFVQAVVWDRGTALPARCENPPYIEDHASPPGNYTLHLSSPVGRYEIEAEVRRSLPHSTMVNGDAIDGVSPKAHIVTWEQGVTFHVEGKPYDGHSERSHWIPQ